MINFLKVTNFRQFQSFSVKLKKGNILVGPNNAGKSSLLDAFRILEACLRYAKTKNPEAIDVYGHGVFRGYRLPETTIPVKLANITRDYSDEDAILEFRTSNGVDIYIRLHHSKRATFYIDAPGFKTHTSKSFREACAIDFVIVPTLSPLEMEERFVEDETIRRNEGTRTSSRHLRNVWYRKRDEEFSQFRKDVSDAWPGISISKPEIGNSIPRIVDMYYSENRVEREVSCAGFGFQVWLQILTHLTRGLPGATLIIDEPDIYLHPDLQKRLLKTISERYEQFIMATHSVEIINDADVSDIVSISKNYRSGKRISTDEDYIKLHRYIGSSENTDFARLARSKKVIFVEGKDGKLIRKLAKKIGLVNLSDEQNTPIIQLGGFSQWRRAADAIWAFRNVLSLEIEAFCLFDRDYRCKEEVSEFVNDLEGRGISCEVLVGKEIENHILIENALLRAIRKRVTQRGGEAESLDEKILRSIIIEISSDMEESVRANRAKHYTDYFEKREPGVDRSSILLRHGKLFSGDWKKYSEKILMLPGKEMLSRINEKIQSQLQVSLTESMIIDAINVDEIDPDFLRILQRLDAFCL
ncbi:ATP-dependent nuclease [Azospirillum lipoferum]|uniref:ATP-dependent nuclease n=1 Tax=Azospirillum lipoferum TaxID=193 RepID=UPI0002E36884|nr:ATP-binding protein [Azospirillum lipoferum]